MRTTLLAALLTFAVVHSAAAQSRASRAPSGFSFDTCYSQCLSRGGSPGSCQPGCAERSAAVQRGQSGGPRGANDDPRSPRFYDPEPRRGFY